MVRLPSIKRRGPQQLATTDPMSVVSEANSRAAAFASLGKAAEQTTQLVSDYAKRENQDQIRQATLAVHQEDTAFRGTNEAAEEFDIMEVEDDNFINIADGLGYEDPESPVPAHRVYAEWRKQNYEDSVKRAASGIRDTRAKDAFLQEHAAKGASSYATDSIQANKKQIQYTAKKTIARVDEAMLNRDFATARLEVNTSTMSSERKKNANDDINLREQNDYFSEVIEKRSIPVMENALNQLRENAPNTSELSADKQKVIANQLRTAIGVEKNAIISGANSQRKLDSEDLTNQVEDYWNNEVVNNESMSKNMASIKGTNPVLYREAEWTRNNQPLVSEILLEGPEEQKIILESFKANTGGDMQKSYLVDKLGKAIEKSNRAFQTDAMRQGDATGLVVLEQIDYSTPEAMGASFAKRAKQAVTIRDNHKAFTGYLTKDEMSVFGNRIENASVEEQLAIFGSISGHLGEYAPPLYEQLKKYNVAGTAALAGQLMAQGPGFAETAKNILVGADLRKNNTIAQLEVKEANLDAVIPQYFGMMFAGNPKHQSLMADAFKDVWAVTKNSEAAFEQLTGGAIDYKGSIIQAPAPGVGGWKYEWHVRDIDPIWWASEDMRAYGYSPEEVRDNVVDGTFKQLGVGAGANNLVTADGSVVTTPDGITPLVFAIDMSEPTIGARDAAHMKAVKDASAKMRAMKKEARVRELQKTWDEIGGPSHPGTPGGLK